MTETEVRQAVQEYCRLHGIDTFELSEMYDLQSDWTNKKQFPYTGKPGCYAFYDEQGTLLYVGKVSLKHTLGSRIASYFNRDSARELTIAKGTWKGGHPRYVQTIPVRSPYEAPSLEEYLIEKLQPPDNTRGIRATRAPLS